MRSADDDLTARARVRDAAITRFAADGFGVGLRTIAADADVSPGLVIHHFRSKEGLRRECDAHVLAQIHDARAEALVAADPASSILRLAADTHYAWLATYLLRSLQAGGDLARRFVADLVDETRTNLEDGVAAGSIRPSRDPDGRADMLTGMSLGYLLLAYSLEPEPPTDLAAWVVGLSTRGTLAGLEVFTEGLFTDSRFLDGYLAQTGGPSSDPHPTTAPTPPHPEDR
ncbi:TetR family transcriptional regulator [Luteimicrobium album]|uniref:TetR family transcriptional regulator n=1 Tax=Luteimicrobium album TaxID=1054550 RepID=A0ABQ6HXB4_9MICO|nr:TetR family transcriptional regulator [Luteimicrobium album]